MSAHISFKMSPSVGRHDRCPVTEVVGLLSDGWTMLIIHHLLRAPAKTLHFCELERKLEGVSTRTLTVKLKDLCKQGIVTKGEKGYLLTPLGRKLDPIIREMERFGKQLL